MSYNHTYAQIKDILKSSKKVTKDMMIEISSLAIKETMGDRGANLDIKWDSKLGDDLELDLSLIHI